MSDLKRIIERDLPSRPPRRWFRALEQRLNGEVPDLVSYGWGESQLAEKLLAVTPSRAIVIDNRWPDDPVELAYPDFVEVRRIDERDRISFVMLICDDQPVETLRVTPTEADRVVATLHRCVQPREPQTRYIDVMAHFPDARVLVYAGEARRDEDRASVSVFPTGIQIEADKWRRFTAWRSIARVSAEGVDQIQQEGNIRALLAFGALGYAARWDERSAFLVVSADGGDTVLQIDGHIPSELRAILAPIFVALEATTAPRSDPDPIEQIRRLAELRDAGAITTEEFEKKKAELLGRL